MGQVFVATRLDSFKIASYRSQAILARNVFAIRHDKSEQFRICGPEIVDCLAQARQKLVKPFVRQMEPRHQQL